MSANHIAELFFIFALQALTTYGSIIANSNTTIRYFSICIATIAWILLLMFSRESVEITIRVTLMAMFPLFMLIFFLSLFEKSIMSKYRIYLLIQFFMGLIFLTTHFFNFLTVYYTLAFLAAHVSCFLICFIVYQKSFKHLRFRRMASLLLLSFIAGFGPFLLFHLLPTYMLGLDSFRRFYWTLYLLLIFPITALTFFKRLEVRPKNYLVFTIFSNITSFLVFFLVMDLAIYFIVSPQFTNILRLNSLTLILVYLIYLFTKWKFETRKQQLATDISLFSEQETNMSYQLLSNEQFESLAKIISDVFLHAYEFKGIAFVWSDNNHSPYFLFKNKQLANLNRKFIDEHRLFAQVDSKLISYENQLVFATPMFEASQVRGLILVSKEESNLFSKDEMDELSKNAKEIALFLRTAEQRLALEKLLNRPYYSEFERAAYIKQHDLAQEDKKKLANYLHDDVLQTLLAVKNLNLSIESKDSKTIDLIDQTLKSLSVSMRDYLTQIYPSFLNVLPLENSFKNLAEKLENIYPLDIEIDWRIEKELSLNETEKVFFYRIVKELLTNAYKHSKASKIEIDLRQEDGENILRIIDNGHGIKRNQLDDEQFYINHLGLLSIKQEVDYKNGLLDIYSGRDFGTEIEVRVPIMKGTET